MEVYCEMVSKVNINVDSGILNINVCIDCSGRSIDNGSTICKFLLLLEDQVDLREVDDFNDIATTLDFIFFQTVTPVDMNTQHLNVEYGKSSKIILSGIIIDWVAMMCFIHSKYHLSVRKEGFLNLSCQSWLIKSSKNSEKTLNLVQCVQYCFLKPLKAKKRGDDVASGKRKD